MDLIVGMKEMAMLHKEEHEKKPPIKKKPPVEDIFIEQDEKPHDNTDDVKMPKAKYKPRGISSKKSPDELAEHLKKMREKAAIVRRAKAEERKKQVSELQEIKLSKKLGIPTETLAEYESIRKSQISKKPELEPNNPPPKTEPSQPTNTVVDYELIVNKLFDKIHTAKQAQEQAKLLKEKQDAEKAIINQREQQRKTQINAQYFSSLGTGRIPTKVVNNDWSALFNRKK